jgi:hypothetical protein
MEGWYTGTNGKMANEQIAKYMRRVRHPIWPFVHLLFGDFAEGDGLV